MLVYSPTNKLRSKLYKCSLKKYRPVTGSMEISCNVKRLFLLCFSFGCVAKLNFRVFYKMCAAKDTVALHFSIEESSGIVDKVLKCDWGDPGSCPS